MNRKRILTLWKDVEDREREAIRVLQEKLKEHVPKDRSKEYVACLECIKNGFPKNIKGNISIHRRERLSNHYEAYHQDQVVQEWNPSSSNKKQRTMISMFQKKTPMMQDDVTATIDEETERSESIISKDASAKQDKTADTITTSPEEDQDSEKAERQTVNQLSNENEREHLLLGKDGSDPDEVSTLNATGWGWGWSSIKKIVDGVKNILLIVKDSYRLLRLIAYKHGVQKQDNLRTTENVKEYEDEMKKLKSEILILTITVQSNQNKVKKQ